MRLETQIVRRCRERRVSALAWSPGRTAGDFERILQAEWPGTIRFHDDPRPLRPSDDAEHLDVVRGRLDYGACAAWSGRGSAILVVSTALGSWPLEYVLDSTPDPRRMSQLLAELGPAERDFVGRFAEHPGFVEALRPHLVGLGAEALREMGSSLLQYLTNGGETWSNVMADALSQLDPAAVEILDVLRWVRGRSTVQVLAALLGRELREISAHSVFLERAGWLRSERGTLRHLPLPRLYFRGATASPPPDAPAVAAALRAGRLRLTTHPPGTSLGALVPLARRTIEEELSPEASHEAASLLSQLDWMGGPGDLPQSRSAGEIPERLERARATVLDQPGLFSHNFLNAILADLPADTSPWFAAAVRLRCASIAWLAGRRGQAALHLNVLPELGEADAPPVARADLGLKAARLFLELGFDEVANERLAALAQATAEISSRSRYELALACAWLELKSGDYAAASRWVESATREAGLSNTTAQSRCAALHESCDLLARGTGAPEVPQIDDACDDVEALSIALLQVGLATRATPGRTAAPIFDALAERSIALGVPAVATVEFVRDISRGVSRNVDEIDHLLPVAHVLAPLLAPGAHAKLRRDFSAELVIHPRGHWFKLRGHDPVDLTPRVPLRRILRHLVELRRKAPDLGASVDELIEVGWPDEAIEPSAAKSRVYSTIRLLREQGMEGFLITDAAGYRLRETLEIDFRNLTIDSARRIRDSTNS